MIDLTPAGLRDLCLFISKNGLNKTDEGIFRLFFSAKEDEKLERAINNFGTGKLKSVISFLKGGDSESPMRIELASIIVDFNPRPFNNYRQKGEAKNGTAVDISVVEGKNSLVGNNLDLGELIKRKGEVVANNNILKTLLFLGAFLFVIFVCYAIKNIIFPTKECMQWKENHYEVVDCFNDKLGIGQLNLIVPADLQTMKLEKLDSNKALVFFKNDKPIVWYYKKDGEIELFNQPGFYPETAKSLKPITNYIIQKYKLKSKE